MTEVKPYISELDEPKRLLDEVWKHLKCKTPKPPIKLRRQHSTALYWPDEHQITIRLDSWAKMHPAEKKLIVTHEALHACHIGHQPGYRTATDSISMLLYKKIWGEDKDWKDFTQVLGKKLEKVLAGEEEMMPFVCDPDEPTTGECP